MKTESEQDWETDGGALHGPRVQTSIADRVKRVLVVDDNDRFGWKDGDVVIAPWTWVQPKNREDLLSRLAAARDLAVSERERENLCSVALGEISRLADALEELVDDCYLHGGGATIQCPHCEGVRHDPDLPHGPHCAVGKAEVILGGAK